MLKSLIYTLLARLPEPIWFYIRLLRDLTHPLTRRRRREIASLDRKVHDLLRAAPEVRRDPALMRRHFLLVQGADTNISLVEVTFALAMIHAGWHVTVLTTHGAITQRWFRWAGVRNFEYWSVPLVNSGAQLNAERARDLGFEGIMSYRYLDARVGLHGISKVIRKWRSGFDPAAPGIWEATVREVNIASAYAEQAQAVLDRLKPDVILFNERGYNREGPLFDLANARGIQCLQWVSAHRTDSLMLKRYRKNTTPISPYSLSDKTWMQLLDMTWGHHQEQAVLDELRECYRSGQWFNETGTQFNRTMYSKDDLRTELGLAPNRKTAIIFAHMFWDASFFYGVDLFRDYEEWFLEAVRAAVANPKLNWLIKAHPANVVKNRRENIIGEKADMERVVLARHIGDLPDHIRFIPSDTPINTYSLFPLMDYCLTVRGTIGMEAACFGIPVITAGTGRYDHRGFTTDPGSPYEYRALVAELQRLPRLKPEQQQTALRFAYGSLLLRPFNLRAVTLNSIQDAYASTRIKINVDSASSLLESPDVQTFVHWVSSDAQEDYINPGRLIVSA